MTNLIEQMLTKYGPDNNPKNAIKEVVQEVVLAGLSRAGFFKSAVFYGGTALRIFYGLDRFSEDLDFSLMTPDSSFELASYFTVLEKEVRSLGLNFSVEEKHKTSDSTIRSAFLKGGTKEHILKFFADSDIAAHIPFGEQIKIKFEVDINPPAFATFEHKYRLQPFPYEVGMYDKPSLFAGKIHAVLCRSWRNRIKGRDLYDYIFFLSQNTPVNLKHLRERLIQSGVDVKNILTEEDLIEMLRERFSQIDYSQAKQDVEPFIKDTRSLDIWSAEFFSSITEGLKGIS